MSFLYGRCGAARNVYNKCATDGILNTSKTRVVSRCRDTLYCIIRSYIYIAEHYEIATEFKLFLCNRVLGGAVRYARPKKDIYLGLVCSRAKLSFRIANAFFRVAH